MFGQIPQTQYDLHFQVFGIPVRIHPAFFVLCAVFGFDARTAQFMGVSPIVPILLFTFVAFISVLFHELGHALLARHFGWPPHIVLHHFGGAAIFQPSHGYTPTKSVLISLAGPGVMFVIYGIFVGIEAVLVEKEIVANQFIWYLIAYFQFINLWWGLLNLLPVYPLDGGQVAEQICRKIDPYRGMEYTLKLGIISAVAAAVGFYLYRRPTDVMGATPCLIFLLLAFNNYQMLEQTSGRRGPW